MTILVTGGTGLLGNNIVRHCLENGRQVRVLVREGCDARPLQGLDVEVVHGDIRDVGAVERACDQVSHVIHAAAAIRIGWSDLQLHREINVDGTRHVAVAARNSGARMVHVSSVDTLGVGTRETPANEDTPRLGNPPCTYVVTKREAEQVVAAVVREDLNAVIVNPGFMLGPWDWKPSSGRMLLEVARGFTPVAPAGGSCLCDVRDVARGVLTASDRGQTGRNYILGGHNTTYFDAWKLFAQVGGGRAPIMKAGPLMRIVAGHFGDLRARITGHEPDVNTASVRMSSLDHYYDSTRAEQELDYRCRPIEESVRDAWLWFRQNGYVD